MSEPLDITAHVASFDLGGVWDSAPLPTVPAVRTLNVIAPDPRNRCRRVRYSVDVETTQAETSQDADGVKVDWRMVPRGAMTRHRVPPKRKARGLRQHIRVEKARARRGR